MRIRCASCGAFGEQKLYNKPPEGWWMVMMSETMDFKDKGNPGWSSPCAPLCEKCSPKFRELFNGASLPR